MRKKKRLRVLFLPGAYFSPSARYRILQLIPFFDKIKYDIKVRTIYPDRVLCTSNPACKIWQKIPSRLSQLVRLFSSFWVLRDVFMFDVVVCNRDIVPDIKVRFIEKMIVRLRIALIIDFDDAIYLGARAKKMNELFSISTHLVAGNQHLAIYASRFNSNITVIPTVVDTNKFNPRKRLGIDDNCVTIGWIGSSGPTIHHLPLVFPALIKLIGIGRYNIKFLIVSDLKPILPKELNSIVEFVAWNEENEVALIQSMDIGLMPLPDSEFEKGKCGFKAIQYMSLSIPALVSPVGVNNEIVTHGINGYLCKSDEDWIYYLEELIKDSEKRKLMGRAARQTIMDKYSIEQSIISWEKVFQDL